MKDGWKYKKLGDLFPYIKNGANIKQSREAKGYPITRIETLSCGVFNRDRLGYANIYEIDKYEDYVLQSHDLLLSHINSKIYIGRTVEYKAEEGETIIHGMNLLRLKSNQKVINSSFFAYYALSTKFKDDIAKIRKDAVNQSSVAISDLKCIRLPLPPLPEQQSIVAELDKINEIIDLKKTQLKDLDLLAQSIFYDMFGEPIENPKGWEVKKLGAITEVGTGSTPNRKNISFYSGNNSWVKSTEVCNCAIYETQEHISEVALEETNCTMYPVNTILMAMYGQGRTRGQIAILKIVACTNQAVAAIIPSPNFESLFLYQHLHLMYDNIRSMARGGNQANLNLSLVKSIKIILPPLSLQHSFADKIKAIESQKTAIKKSLAEVETLLASRMDYYFN